MARGAPERLVAGYFGSQCRRRWGWSPRTIPALVEQKGAVGAFFWLLSYIWRYRATTLAFGPLRTHLTCTAVALHNDCAYSAQGHAHALEMHYFRERNRLFPVTAQTIAGWHGLGTRELGERLRGALHEAGMHVEAVWVQRILDLAAGTQQPVDVVEVRLARVVGAVTVMNHAVRSWESEPEGAMDPINRDAALKARMAAARAAEAAVTPPEHPASGPPPHSLHGC